MKTPIVYTKLVYTMLDYKQWAPQRPQTWTQFKLDTNRKQSNGTTHNSRAPLSGQANSAIRNVQPARAHKPRRRLPRSPWRP